MMDENKTFDALEDEEMTALFAAFDDMSASDSLVDATLERIAAAEGEDKPVVQAVSAKGRRRARFRAIRVAVIAACLVLALTGGVAYAVPVSHVTMNQGDTSIELGVNVFGVTVTASSESEEGRQIIESTSLLNMSFEDSLSHAYDAMSQRDPDHAVQISVESGDPGQRERLEGESESFMAERGQYDQPAEQGEQFDQPSEHGQPDQSGQPDQADQPGQGEWPGQAGQPDQPSQSGDDQSGQPDSSGQPGGGSQGQQAQHEEQGGQGQQPGGR